MVSDESEVKNEKALEEHEETVAPVARRALAAVDFVEISTILSVHKVVFDVGEGGNDDRADSDLSFVRGVDVDEESEIKIAVFIDLLHKIQAVFTKEEEVLQAASHSRDYFSVLVLLTVDEG